jgi:hypothetical protein
VLRYLWWFGLLEEARAAANDDGSSPSIFRKTPHLAFKLDTTGETFTR